jgi:hypothetical protein
VLDVVATAFFIRLYLVSRRPSAGRGLRHALLVERSWLLLLMSVTNTIITSVFLFIGYLAVRRVLGLPLLEWGAAATLLALVLLGAVPIIKMVAFWLARDRHA